MTLPNRRRLRRGLLVVLLLVGTVIAMLGALQRQLIYFPDPTPVPPAAEVIPGARVADQAPSLVERVVLAGADHNDPVMFGSRVAAAVARLAHSVD